MIYYDSSVIYLNLIFAFGCSRIWMYAFGVAGGDNRFVLFVTSEVTDSLSNKVGPPWTRVFPMFAWPFWSPLIFKKDNVHDYSTIIAIYNNCHDLPQSCQFQYSDQHNIHIILKTFTNLGWGVPFNSLKELHPIIVK